MSHTCEFCDTSVEVKFCTACNDYYCDKCWDKRRAHKDNKPGAGGIPHEKVDPKIVESIEECIAEPEDESDEETQHVNDQDTTWFGIDQDTNGEPVLADYSRYAAIMMESGQFKAEDRFPGLVSFVGQSGAGKSTLIRLLIDPKAHQQSKGLDTILAPIVGRSASEMPTSADVHLYLDPHTLPGNRPILFADCEGFEGGERDPVAAGSRLALPRSSQIALDQQFGHRLSMASSSSSNSTSLRSLFRNTVRTLTWASRDAPNHAVTSKRQYVVAEMYPRIFYAFSDVIVFVLVNPKTLEDVVEKLLHWADANYSKSINLPSKPHAIIALNKSSNSTPDVQWDHFYATEDLFRAMNPQLRKNKTFRAYVEKWEAADREIDNMKDLLRCYYSSTHVVRLPDKSRYQKLHKQRHDLGTIVSNCCEDSLKKKQQYKMLPNVDQFGLYLSLAFDHFSRTLDEPFDHIKASLKLQPPPETLSEGVLTFAILVGETLKIDGSVEELFNLLTPMVASCLILDAVRKQRFGKPKDWFQAASIQQLSPTSQKTTSYEGLCKSVLLEYFETRVKCAFFRERKGVFGVGRVHKCDTVKRMHGEMHRQKTRTGTLEHFGSFDHPFKIDDFAWESKILAQMRDLEGKDSWSDNTSAREARVSAHRKMLGRFYYRLDLFCNSVCIGCLMNPPEHRLECGHIICSECVKDFGTHYSHDKTQHFISQCPLHGQEHRLNYQHMIPFAPEHSGLRVLILDGGGVRGIVELRLLKAIEDRIGVPLQRFFDLVVGTSTGGIISLAFGHELWSTEKCIQMFESLVEKAFKLRKGQELDGIRHIQLLVKKSRYEARGLEGALREAFSSDADLIASDGRRGPRPLKVAVTATSEAGTNPYILSNYNTRSNNTSAGILEKQELKYTRYRARVPEEELKVWEAARATSAAPGYFTPFGRKANTPYQVFPELMDGGILHNNPVNIAISEAQKLALAANQSLIPDIVLSLGTGLSQETEAQVLSGDKEFGLPRLSKPNFFRNMFSLVKYQIKLNLDSQRRWNQYVRQFEDKPEWSNRLFRLNPDLEEEPPKMDDVGKVQPLKLQVTGWVDREEVRALINEIACTLVASSFFFERGENLSKSAHQAGVKVTGSIKCRIKDIPELRGLGSFLASCHAPAKFVVRHLGMHQIFDIPVHDMQYLGRYNDVLVEIEVPGTETQTTLAIELPGMVPNRRFFNLSGFPRDLVAQDYKL